jgi:alpha-beta hydrolase superfamily lysophospholipase
MGAIIGQMYLVRYQDDLAGCVFSGTPARVPDRVSPLAVAVAGVLSRVTPKLPVQRVAPAGQSSRDPEVVALTLVDPLCYNGPTMARTGHEMLLALREMERRRGEITLPLLLLHGEADRTIPLDSVEIVARSVSSQDLTKKTYPGLYHEVLNEPEKETVLDDIRRWFEPRLPGRAR